MVRIRRTELGSVGGPESFPEKKIIDSKLLFTLPSHAEAPKNSIPLSSLLFKQVLAGHVEQYPNTLMTNIYRVLIHDMRR